MINIKNLVKRYDDFFALHHVNLHINRGVIFGLLGPNGAGKTTLISILNGLSDFQEGEIEICGMSLHKNIKKIRRWSSFVPQSLALYNNLSVIENLRFFAGIQQISGAAQQKNIERAIVVNQLQPMLKQRAETLSGGQKRRLNIAIGLLNNPDILYLDEPTVGIDPESRNDILSMIQGFKDQNKTVIYTSHYMAEIEKICDEVAIIDRGRILKQGRLATILQEYCQDSVIIELLDSDSEKIKVFSNANPQVQVMDSNTMILASKNAADVGLILTALEANKMRVKQINYGTENLESLFIRLTSQEIHHA